MKARRTTSANDTGYVQIKKEKRPNECATEEHDGINESVGLKPLSYETTTLLNKQI